MLVCSTEATTEVEDGIIIFQWQMSQEIIQLTETIPDVRQVGFMGFLIDLVQLIQDGLAVTFAWVKGMCFDIDFQPPGDIIHCRSAPFG